MDVKGVKKVAVFIRKHCVMPRPRHSVVMPKNRIVFVFDERPERRIAHGVSHAVILTIVTVGGIGKKQIISRDNLVVVCGPTYFIPQRISLKDLTEYPTLLREHGSASRDLLDSVLSANGMTITPVIESASNQALIACAEHNIGVAVLPQKLVAEPIKKNRLKVIEVDDNSFERCYYIVHHKNKRFSQSQKKIISTALTVF